MAIAYIYYDNNQAYLTAYLWEKGKENQRYKLKPYVHKANCFACKEIMVDFDEYVCHLKLNGYHWISPLKEPAKDILNLKHQAHFDIKDSYVECF
jgi:hypothetical protein